MAAASDGQAGRDDDRSKFEDMPRSVWFEMFKSAVLFVFQVPSSQGIVRKAICAWGFASARSCWAMMWSAVSDWPAGTCEQAIGVDRR
jgi:hypothetical protein